MNLNLKDLSHDKLIELIESLILEVNYLKEENRLLKEENQKLKAQLGLKRHKYLGIYQQYIFRNSNYALKLRR